MVVFYSGQRNLEVSSLKSRYTYVLIFDGFSVIQRGFESVPTLKLKPWDVAITYQEIGAVRSLSFEVKMFRLLHYDLLEMCLCPRAHVRSPFNLNLPNIAFATSVSEIHQKWLIFLMVNITH